MISRKVCLWVVTGLKIQIKALKKDVIFFLEEVREAINNNKYIILDRDKNTKTLVNLNFNKQDALEELKALEINDYVCDLPDEKKPEEDNYKVFWKKIQREGIYIKIKLKKAKFKYLFCMSFHIGEHEITKFPYK